MTNTTTTGTGWAACTLGTLSVTRFTKTLNSQGVVTSVGNARNVWEANGKNPLHLVTLAGPDMPLFASSDLSMTTVRGLTALLKEMTAISVYVYPKIDGVMNSLRRQAFVTMFEKFSVLTMMAGKVRVVYTLEDAYQIIAERGCTVSLPDLYTLAHTANNAAVGV